MVDHEDDKEYPIPKEVKAVNIRESQYQSPDLFLISKHNKKSIELGVGSEGLINDRV